MQPKPCAICGQPMDYIRGGVSKRTGEPYNAFWACKDQTHKQPRAVAPQQVATYQQVPRFAKPPEDKPEEKKEEKVNWDKIAEGKVRHAFAIEAFKFKMDLNQNLVDIIEAWTKYVMSGKLPYDAEEVVDDDTIPF